jgi:septum formation protein
MMPSSETNTTAPPPLILASGSPRRAELLRAQGFAVRIVQPPLHEPEELSDDIKPAAQAEALSYFKARSVRPLVKEGVIIGGDTVVTLAGRCFGKPADREDARRILENITGTTHQVITGVTLLDAATGRRRIEHDTTEVTMRRMTGEELAAYLDSGAWEGKAGAYGIQDRADAFVERIRGSFTNVVGLPMELLTRMLAEWGIEPARPSATFSPSPTEPDTGQLQG